ncbi:MAG: transcription elongation factor GreA [Parcubacteria group bacterium Gr01-1014_19]|nr:MAG: transcription elongation factor GreA [Parcubacteria group bacterium Gr01-1014_19]
MMVRDESPIPLTKEALEQLKQKLARLKASLPDQISTTKAAADLGDRSENAEYQISKSRLRSTHRQILTIEDQIKRAVIIKPSSSGKIQLGSTVVLQTYDETTNDSRPNKKTLTFQILGSFETNPGKGVISNQSPLGAALMNHKIGDEIIVKIGGGEKKYRILEIQ